jgi:rubrerythrin
MAIKKGKRTLEYERQYEEFIENCKEDNHEVNCPRHGLIFVRKDLEAKCPSCSPSKDN